VPIHRLAEKKRQAKHRHPGIAGHNNFTMPKMYAGIVTIAAIGFLVNQTLVRLEKKYSGYRPGSERSTVARDHTEGKEVANVKNPAGILLTAITLVCLGDADGACLMTM
jgi:hypothetical protein